MTTLVFGHKSPDTDSTGSPILWAWYLKEVKGIDAEAVLLGEPNTEAAFMLERWNLPKPRIISDVEDGQACVIVDTNNPAELPANVNGADVQAIIDHHKLVGGLETKGPIDITVRPLACTATIMVDLMGEESARMPEWAKGAALTCILSDTLEFRSPTTTDQDRALAEALAADLGISIPAYAAAATYHAWPWATVGFGAWFEAALGSARRRGGEIDARVLSLGATASWRALVADPFTLRLSGRGGLSYVRLQGEATDASAFAQDATDGVTGTLAFVAAPTLRSGAAAISLPLEIGGLFRAPRGRVTGDLPVQLDGALFAAGLAVSYGFGARDDDARREASR